MRSKLPVGMNIIIHGLIVSFEFEKPFRIAYQRDKVEDIQRVSFD